MSLLKPKALARRRLISNYCEKNLLHSLISRTREECVIQDKNYPGSHAREFVELAECIRILGYTRLN